MSEENNYVDEILDSELDLRAKEIKSYKDLAEQRGTSTPALFNMFYKFIQNPSTVSVETYKRMVDTDDTINSGVNFMSMLLAARMGRYTHPSQEVTQFINKALDQIDGGFVNHVKEILSGIWAGFSVSEQVWANTELGFVVKKLVHFPPSTVQFKVERTGELSKFGVYQYMRSFNPNTFGGGAMGFSGGLFPQSRQKNDPYAKFGDLPFPLRIGTTYSYMAVPIPTEKLLVYSFNAQGGFGNPYGRSLLRSAYKWYISKDAILQMMLTALDRKGTPLNVVFADPSVTVVDQDKGDRTNGAMRDRRDAGISGDKAALKAFNSAKNDTTIVLPGMKGQAFDIHTVPNDSNTSSFIDAIKLCNSSIMRSMLLPSLIFTSGDGTGSYSLGQEHAKTFDKILDSILEGVTETIKQQLIKKLIAYNFPESAWKKDGLGGFGKREMSQEEREKVGEMFSRGISDGYIDINDLKDMNYMREAMGMEPYDKMPDRQIVPEPFTPGDPAGSKGKNEANGKEDQTDDTTQDT